MEQIRYTKRNCTDQKKINLFLLQERVGVLGMASGDFPYAVPVNYVWYNGSVYFHGMGSGKKEAILSQEPLVCFTIYKEHGTVTDAVPCHADTAYMSVMLFGKAVKVAEPDEAAAVLQKLLDKYMSGYYKNRLTGTLIDQYRSAHDGNAVAVYRITPQQITAKENEMDSSNLFEANS